jgi:4,5-dihydroxyphthalate decarboxylase
MLVRAFEDPAFNVAELSLSNYVTRRARGDCPYVAIPVYIARSFRQGDIYVRTDRNISAPRDLRGKRIGIAEYEHTLYVWVRGMLEDEYGVRPQDVKWVSVSAHAPGPSEFQPPSGISIEHVQSTRTLSDMLENGEIDALISVLPPPCFIRGAPHIARLFPGHRAVEDDYFRRTGVFPILHIMGIRKELVERHPVLAQNVFKAFLAAKDVALAAEAVAAARPSTPTQLASSVTRMTALMGKDYYSYGLNERDCRTLDLFLDYHFRQGLSDRRFEIAELFTPVLLSEYGGD